MSNPIDDRDGAGSRRAEESLEFLRRSEERFRLLTISMSDIVWTRTPTGDFETEQPSWGAFTGQTREEYQGWGWLSAVHPEDRDRVRSEWVRAIGERTGSIQIEKRVRRADGDYRHLRVRAIALYDDTGAVREWFGTDVDLTDEVRAARERELLAESSRVLGASLEYEGTLATVARLAVPQFADWCAVDLVEYGAIRRLAVAHRDPDKVELAYRLTAEYPPDPDAKQGVRNILRTGQPEIMSEIPQALIDAATRDESHGQLIRELGLRSYIGVPLTARGEVLGVLTFIATHESGRIFTEPDLRTAEALAGRAAAAIDNARLYREAEDARERAEDQAQELENQAAEMEEVQAELELSNDELQRANDELQRANVEIELRRSHAEAADRAKSDFLANMSHEIRTPINAIIGYTELIEMGLAGPISDQQRVQLERIRASSGHLLALINDVLDLSKIEAGQMSAVRDRIKLGPVMTAALELLRPQAPAGLEFGEFCHEQDNQYVLGDQDRTRQILVNLLSNAIKFTEPPGRITVSCGLTAEADPETVLGDGGPWGYLRVEDSGIGIAPEAIESIFDPFVQVEAGRTRTKGGTGLGLTISRTLARLMGGDLTVRSTPGQGSTFTLWLAGVEE